MNPSRLQNVSKIRVEIGRREWTPVHRTRTNIALDLFNIFNANPVLTYNQSVPSLVGGAAYLSPTSALSARLAKLTVQVDW